MVSKPEGVTLGAQRVTGTHEASHHLAMPLPANSPPQPPGGLLSWAYSTVKLGPPPAPGQAVSIVSRLSGGRSSAEPSQRPHPEGPLTTPARTWEGVTQLVPRCGVHVTPRPASRAAGPLWVSEVGLLSLRAACRGTNWERMAILRRPLEEQSKTQGLGRDRPRSRRPHAPSAAEA